MPTQGEEFQPPACGMQVPDFNWPFKKKQIQMKRLATIALMIGILALGACASSKPCPAYAKAQTTQNPNS
jgi:hypothetical protein